MLLMLLLSFSTKAQAQQQQLDSLQLTLKKAANDTAKMIALVGLYDYYAEIDRDMGLLYGNQAMGIATKLTSPFG